jgi:hypothetical protein
LRCGAMELSQRRASPASTAQSSCGTHSLSKFLRAWFAQLAVHLRACTC